jgi:hypothetical protein
MGAVGYLFLMKNSNVGVNKGYWLPLLVENLNIGRQQ